MTDEKILILDDEPAIVQLCERLLERANFKVTAMSSPFESVKLLKEEQFELLLVDIRMPELSGFEVIERAKELQPDLAVVIMTGFGTLETAIRALKQGADGLILKPFEQTIELVKTVQEALEQRKQKIENARLRAIRPLLDMTESLFSETRNDQVLDLIVKAIIDHMHCNHAGIYRKMAGSPELTLIAGQGKTLPDDFSRGEGGIVGRSDLWQVPIWVNLAGPGNADLRPIIEKQGLGGVICTPISRDTSSLVFFAGRDINQPAFQMADLELFNILARQADTALENARLYEELRAYLRQVEDSQRALIQAEKMVAVGRLTASIAHEINNPLQGLQNCLHLAGRKELPVEKRENYLTMAEEELNRLMSTVQRMLDFYRPGAIDRVSVDIHEILDKTFALLEKQFVENNIEVKMIYEERLPEVSVVANQIQQVFFNLMLNAIDALAEGGKLEITTSLVGNHLQILFHDFGKGIRDGVHENIFEPFFSTKDQGSGLGLSISYGILTAHGGELELMSEIEEGTCFKVLLPV